MFLLIQKSNTNPSLIDVSNLPPQTDQLFIQLNNSLSSNKIKVLAKFKEIVQNVELQVDNPLGLLPCNEQIEEWLSSQEPNNIAKVRLMEVFQKAFVEIYPALSQLDCRQRDPVAETTFTEQDNPPSEVTSIGRPIKRPNSVLSEQAIQNFSWEHSDPRKIIQTSGPLEFLLRKKDNAYWATFFPDKNTIVVKDSEFGLRPETPWNSKIYSWCLPSSIISKTHE